MKRKVGLRVDLSNVELKVHEVIAVAQLPTCNFCEELAEYDFKTDGAPWAYGCEGHYLRFRASPALGTGSAQLLVASSTVREVVSAS